MERNTKRAAKTAGKKSIEKQKGNSITVGSINAVHDFNTEEIHPIRKALLSWYDQKKRDLPWRQWATKPDLNQRAYAIWVSEVMLQQTQVATVVDYYNKWMKKWPTLQDLAGANLEEVNEMWSGLGYYSRGRRLHEGAQKVVKELGGEMPKTAVDLLKQLPGVGRYTASAIASICYREATGVVDGNVIRVLSRLRLIGAGSTAQHTMDIFWSHANKLVDTERPGDFNQAVMELGATVCTPKTPDCSSCPLTTHCKAYVQVEHHKKQSAAKLTLSEASDSVCLVDIECVANNCKLCLPEDEPWDSSLGVMNYPRKGKKKAPRVETSAVCLLCKKCEQKKDKYLIVQRPQKGLLAGLWEFPSHSISDGDPSPDMLKILKKQHGLSVDGINEKVSVGQVVHIFSHIHQTYSIEAVTVSEDCITEDELCGGTRWVTKDELLKSAISTSVKKVFKAFEKCMEEKRKKGNKRKRESSGDCCDGKKQMAISAFFRPKNT